MTHTAYNLSSDFIEELWKRIHTLATSSLPSTIFGNIPEKAAFIPSREYISQAIDAAVWTSFATDEGNAVTLSIILNPAEDSANTFLFEEPISFDVKNLVKLGAALENPKAHIGIWPDNEQNLHVWGFKNRTVNTLVANLCVEAIGPGRVLITYGGKSLAAVIGNEALFIDHSNLLKILVPKLSASIESGHDKMLCLMRYLSLLNTARKMREHTRGGILLVVPDSDDWRHSIDTPMPYKGGTNFLESDYDVAQKPSLMSSVTDFFGALVKNKTVSERETLEQLSEQVEQQCRRIAMLTAVDGALAMSYDRFVYCFGAKIIPAPDQISPTKINVLKPVEDNEVQVANVMDLGGTRHQSAARFAHAQPGSTAIAVSQDGDVTILTTDPETKELVAVQQAELAVIPEGLGAALWSYSQFSDLGLL